MALQDSLPAQLSLHKPPQKLTTMADTSVEDSLEIRKDGFFDNVYSIFEAHHHPLIIVEEAAMRWMGLRVAPEDVSNDAVRIFHWSITNCLVEP